MYFFWPETAQLSLEEINAKFGDDVAVNFNEIPEDERRGLDEFLKTHDILHMEDGSEKGKTTGITEEV